jgi:hypothetical protein
VMHCSSAINTLPATNPIRHGGCLLMQFSTSTPRIRSIRRSRFTRVRTMSSITAMRPTVRFSIRVLSPISPMVARHSRTHVQ